MKCSRCFVVLSCNLVLLSASTVRGQTLGKEAFLTVIRNAQDTIEACYRGRDPALAPPTVGVVEVEFTIAASGATIDAGVSRNTLGTDAVEKCVVAAVQTLRFPTSGSGPIKARYAFQFREDRPFPIPPEPEPPAGATANAAVQNLDRTAPKILRIAAANNSQLEAGYVLLSLCGTKLLTPDDYFETMNTCQSGNLVVKRSDGYEKTVAFYGAKNLRDTHEVVLEGERELREAWLRRKAAPYCLAVHEAATAVTVPGAAGETAIRHVAEVFSGEAKLLEEAAPYLRECDADAVKVFEQLSRSYADRLRGHERNAEEWVELHGCMQKDPFDPSRCQNVTVAATGFPHAFDAYVKALPNPEPFGRKAEQQQGKRQEAELQALAKRIRGYFKHCADVSELVKKASNGMKKCKYKGCTAQEQGRHQLALEEAAQYLESGEDGAPQWLAAQISGLAQPDEESNEAPIAQKKEELSQKLRREALSMGCLLPY